MANINRQRSACSPTNKYLSFNASANKCNNSTVAAAHSSHDDQGVLVGRSTSTLAASSAGISVGNNGVYVGAMVKPLEFQSTHQIILHILGLPISAVQQQLTLRQLRVAIYFGVLIVCAFLYETVVIGDLTYLCHRLSTTLVLPLFAIACGYYWLAVAYRNTWSSTSIYLLFCACYVGEVIAQCCFQSQQQEQEHSLAELEEKQNQEEIEEVNRASNNIYNGMPIIIESRGFSGLYLLLTQAPLLLTVSAAGYLSSLRTVRENVVVGGLVFVSRILAVTQLTALPRSIRPFVSYTCGLVGIVMAKYMEAVFNCSVDRPLAGSNGSSSVNNQSINSSAMSTSNSSHLLLPSPDSVVGGRMSAGRRRRASSSANLQVHGPKGRRTSLPAISLQKNPQLTSNQGGMSSLDIALLSEAHGLITDMLADTSLPLHVVSGLRALSNLLSPPASNHSQSHSQRLRFAALNNDFNLGSAGATVADGEEIPIMGEKLSALPKKFRKSFQASLLRRMSTSTWTTTTSATGMPTLEPEPCRKRSTSFRNPPDLITSSSPTSQLLAVQDHYCLHERTPVSKYRSYSTTSLMVNPSPNRRLSRERKTVCSLHPLTINDINRLHFLSDAAIAASGDGGGSSGGEDNDDDRRSYGAGDLSDGGCEAPTSHGGSYDSLGLTLGNGGGASSGETSPCLSPRVSQGGSGIVVAPSSLVAAIPSIRRVINPPPTCSECENNESSSNSENNSLVLPVGDGTAIKLSETRDPDVCFTIGQSPDVSPSIEQADLDCLADLGSGRVIYVEDGTRYDLERLAEDHYLERINEWDYPIFELEQLNQNSVLSKMCYRVFLEAGLFETFRIPLQEFLAYFHALECGYREKPYHNRMHAADVLHAVFYLTTQPIPGFAHLPLEESPPPVQKSDTGSSSPGLVQRQSFNAEDTYGIMGANLPALELMALYTAAAMHDYEHPGRTNAFLVTTYAPQAILYNDRSVLENHHAAAAWSLFLSKPDYNFLCHLDKAEFKRFRFLVIEAILATDLKRHFEILAEFNAKATDDDAPGIDWNLEADRLLAMEMCIKLADINGPCKKHDIHVQWTKRIADEFYEQGDEEASLGLQISPFMDRLNPQLAKLQDSFINHLVAPLCTSYGEAGFLPGQWVQGSESEDETGNDELDDKQNGESDTRQKKLLKRSKIVSLQAQHLKENHDHWAIKVREEQQLLDSSPENARVLQSPPSGSSSPENIDDQSSMEMETIDEEGCGLVDKGLDETTTVSVKEEEEDDLKVKQQQEETES